MKNTKYKIPNLEKEYKLRFKEEFLKLNGLQIGDEVEMEFNYEKITREKSKEHKVTFSKTLKGILKETEEGFLYAESLEVLPFYKFVNHIRRGYYESTPRKSVIKFGTGFIN